MVNYRLQCPKCNTDFEFDYNQFVKISSLGIVFAYGPHTFSVKCPECRKRSRYHVSDEDLAP